jgi:23S rRNA (uracil1939-C5)-methyltransferase
MDYAGECEAKRARVEEALRRIGGADVRVTEFLAAEETERYRNKAQYPVGPAGPGFYRAGSHAVVPVADCRLLPEAVNAAAGAVGRWMARYGATAYDEASGTGLLRHVYVRHGQAGGTLVCLVTAGTGLPHRDALCQMLKAAVPGLSGVVQNVNREKTNVVLGSAYRTVWGADHLMDELCGKHFLLSVPSFYQVNRKQAERLYAKVLEYAALTGVETVLDLYCGIGTITLCLAEKAKCAVGAEIVPAAVRDAEENARRNGAANVRFLCADAAEAARKFAAEGLTPDVIVVDPPRKGLAEDAVRTVAEMAPRRVVYVSCDPATLARDVARFAALGYCVSAAAAADLFPRTAHVETVVLITRVKE